MSATVGKMRIGEVHALLRQDYPDIELSKIRYYEDKGLVAPDRSRKGYRLYSGRDVACLREAIRLAQEEFVPLRVVRVRLIEQGLLADDPAPASRQAARDATARAVSITVPEASVAAASIPKRAPVMAVVANDDAPRSEWLTRDEFLVASGLANDVLAQLEGQGIVVRSHRGGSVVYGDVDLRIARAAGDLATRGVDVRFLGSLRRVVEREIGVIDDMTEPLRGPSSELSTDEVRTTTMAVAGEVAALREVLRERSLAQYLDR